MDSQGKVSLPRTIIICANSSWNLFNYRSGLIRALIASGDSVVALAPRDTSTENVEALSSFNHGNICQRVSD